MNFILTISLCSFINNQCLPPVVIEQLFPSWKECTIAALDISKQLVITQKDAFVNEKKIATKFMCTKQEQV